MGKLSLKQCEELQGKTVLKVHHGAVNEVRVYFTDGTSLVLESELVNASLNLHGISATVA